MHNNDSPVLSTVDHVELGEAYADDGITPSTQ